MKSRCRNVSGGCNFTRDSSDDVGSVLCVCVCVRERATGSHSARCKTTKQDILLLGLIRFFPSIYYIIFFSHCLGSGVLVRHRIVYNHRCTYDASRRDGIVGSPLNLHTTVRGLPRGPSHFPG